MGNFRLTQIFVIAFLIDFPIRIFIYPRFALSMILGRLEARKKTPDWAVAMGQGEMWRLHNN